MLSIHQHWTYVMQCCEQLKPDMTSLKWKILGWTAMLQQSPNRWGNWCMKYALNWVNYAFCSCVTDNGATDSGKCRRAGRCKRRISAWCVRDQKLCTSIVAVIMGWRQCCLFVDSRGKWHSWRGFSMWWKSHLRWWWHFRQWYGFLTFTAICWLLIGVTLTGGLSWLLLCFLCSAHKKKL